MTLTATDPKRITLKGYRSSPSLSEETLAMRATVLLDGKPVGDVSNDGHGGPNCFHATTHEARAAVAAIVAAHPPRVTPYGTLKMTEDLFFGVLVEAEEERKARATWARKAKKLPPGWTLAALVYPGKRIDLRAPLEVMPELIAKVRAEAGPEEALWRV